FRLEPQPQLMGAFTLASQPPADLIACHNPSIGAAGKPQVHLEVEQRPLPRFEGERRGDAERAPLAAFLGGGESPLKPGPKSLIDRSGAISRHKLDRRILFP